MIVIYINFSFKKQIFFFYMESKFSLNGHIETESINISAFFHEPLPAQFLLPGHGPKTNLEPRLGTNTSIVVTYSPSKK